MITETQRVSEIIKNGAKSSATRLNVIEKEIQKWLDSDKRKKQVIGKNYYLGLHDILERKRTVIGKDGSLTEIENLPNARIVDNQYSNMVDQKANYLFSKPITFESDKTVYVDSIKSIFNKKFLKKLKALGADSLNGGIGWLYIYVDEDNTLSFKRFEPFEVKPFWKDSEHTELDFAVRVYDADVYDGRREKTVKKADIYTVDGVEHYIYKKGKLIADIENPPHSYLTIIEDEDSKAFGWGRIPLVAFKYNHEEIPLIRKIKCIQDSINRMLSDFDNNMSEDARNTILVLKNFDGANLAEFRHNIAAYGAVRVRDSSDGGGGVDTLRVEVNKDNYEAILKQLKRALIENARGFDAKDERMSNNPNQMNIQSAYSDINLDADNMETEYQSSFEELLYFVNMYQQDNGVSDIDEDMKIIFNRDMPLNTSEIIDNCINSQSILSKETVMGKHPWVIDVDDEKKKKQEDEKKLIVKTDPYKDDFEQEDE